MLTGDQESTWSLLLKNLPAGDCVPFLGAGACHERIPLGEQMALNWGETEGYPLADTTNLPRVMQYIATARYGGDAITLKHDFVRREISGVAAPDFSDSGQIHGVLARLDLPLYVTTNYDDFMFLALQHWRKLPRFDYSPWYVTGEGDTHDSPLTDRAYQATPRTPLVYHLHGHYERPQSLVLTEDDYIEYLVQLASDTHHHAGTTWASFLLSSVVNCAASRFSSSVTACGTGHSWSFSAHCCTAFRTSTGVITSACRSIRENGSRVKPATISSNTSRRNASRYSGLPPATSPMS